MLCIQTGGIQMTYLYKLIESLKMSADSKNRLWVLSLSLCFGATGLLVWVILRGFCLSSPLWGLCFFGYPALFSQLFFFRYAFHDK